MGLGTQMTLRLRELESLAADWSLVLEPILGDLQMSVGLAWDT